MTNALLVHSSSDSGRVRDHNEDSVYPAPGELPEPIQHPDGTYHLLVVADGVGGHSKGELASAAAITALRDVLERGLWSDPAEALRDAFREANNRVHAEADDRATTLVAALVKVDSQEMWIANVGDSRIYLAADGRLAPLMRDHSKVAEMVARGQLTNEQARTAPGRNVLTRAIGPDATVQADVLGPLKFLPGQRLLLCSDGLYTMIDEEQMMPLALGADLGEATETLVDAANAAGGHDNVTVLLASLAQEGAPLAAPIVPEPALAAVAPLAGSTAPPGGVKVLGRRVSVVVLAAALAAVVAGFGLVAALLLGGGDAGEGSEGPGQAGGSETASAAPSAPRATRTSTPGASPSASPDATAAPTESPTGQATTASAPPGATATPRPPTATPVPGAPTVSNLSCSPASAAINAEVTCNATIAGAARIRWTSAGNPGDVSGGTTYATRFDSVGVKTIIVQACNSAGICAAPTFNIEVRAAATATPTPSPTATATATATPTATTTPTPTVVTAPGPAPAPPPPGPGGICPPILPVCP